MGYTRQHTADLTLWCSEECRDVPISENNPRDELMVELQASGVLVSHLARAFGITRQAVAQILDRRTGKKVRRRPSVWEPPKPIVTTKPEIVRPRRGRVR
jgi:hypothetical protein